MDKPSIGRRVWYRPNGSDPEVGVIDGHQPCDAGIVFVWSDTLVNLFITDHNCIQHRRTSVPLLAAGAPKPATGAYCEWMPWQIKQAKAAAAPAADLSA